jgi:hypothetical protein
LYTAIPVREVKRSPKVRWRRTTARALSYGNPAIVNRPVPTASTGPIPPGVIGRSAVNAIAIITVIASVNLPSKPIAAKITYTITAASNHRKKERNKAQSSTCNERAA